MSGADVSDSGAKNKVAVLVDDALSVGGLVKGITLSDIMLGYHPFWEEMQWKTLLYNYINLVIQDAVALDSREFDKELDIFERMLLASLAMGDYLGDGLYQMSSELGHLISVLRQSNLRPTQSRKRLLHSRPPRQPRWKSKYLVIFLPP